MSIRKNLMSLVFAGAVFFSSGFARESRSQPQVSETTQTQTSQVHTQILLDLAGLPKVPYSSIKERKSSLVDIISSDYSCKVLAEDISLHYSYVSKKTLAFSSTNNHVYFLQRIRDIENPKDEDAQHRYWKEQGADLFVMELDENKINRAFEATFDLWGGANYAYIAVNSQNEIFIHEDTGKGHGKNMRVYDIKSGKLKSEFGVKRGIWDLFVNPADNKLYVSEGDYWFGKTCFCVDFESKFYKKFREISPNQAVVYIGFDKGGNLYKINWENYKKGITKIEKDNGESSVVIQTNDYVSDAGIFVGPKRLISLLHKREDNIPVVSTRKKEYIAGIDLATGEVSPIARLVKENTGIAGIDIDGYDNIYFSIVYNDPNKAVYDLGQIVQLVKRQ